MTDESWAHIGVDRDGPAWIAVGYSAAGSVGAAVFDRIDDLWTAHGATAQRIVVDTPIGLCDTREAADPSGTMTDGELSRRCDDLARAVLGSRSSSVFTAPCREAAVQATAGVEYSDVNATNKRRTGKGLTQQAANIAPAIVAVDDLLRGSADPTILVEGHPEVCFRAFSDSDLAYSKKTAPGVVERLRILESTGDYERGTWRRLARALATDGHSVGVDDLLDACVLAVTAAAPDDEVQTLPADPPTDAEGLPMQMVYRRTAPFAVD